jgi:hypothetical protein
MEKSHKEISTRNWDRDSDWNATYSLTFLGTVDALGCAGAVGVSEKEYPLIVLYLAKGVYVWSDGLSP